MYHIVESGKSFEQAAIDLDAAVRRHQFGVLHVHDLGATLRGKGLPLGLQVLTKRWDEESMFAVSQVLEDAAAFKRLV